jgi:putative phage-type endonuclease
VAPILGLSRWEDNDEWAVYLKKTKQAPEKAGNLAMDLGLLLEPVVTTLYERRTGRTCFDPKRLVQHPHHDCLIGSPDRLIVGERRGLEIKTAGYRDDQWGAEGTDQVPVDYLLQCVHYMAVCDIDVWDLAVLFLGQREFALYTIRRDRELEREIIEKLVAWWELRIVRGVEPDPGPSIAYSEHLHRKFPRHKEGLVLAPGRDIALAVLEWHKAKQALDAWEIAKRNADNRLKALMGEAERCKGPNWSVSWKAQAPRTYVDWESIAGMHLATLPEAERAALVAAHSKQGEAIRPLRINVNSK